MEYCRIVEHETVDYALMLEKSAAQLRYSRLACKRKILSHLIVLFNCVEYVVSCSCRTRVFRCSTDACRPSPCQHIGWCRRSFNGGYKCVCRKGYSGKNCEIGEYRCVTVQCIRCTCESQTVSILVELTEFKRRGTK